MKYWNMLKFKIFPKNNERNLALLTDVLAWLKYNKGSFDWVDAEWEKHLQELEKND